MKYLKYALYAVAALVVLLVAAVTIVASTFDPNSYKPQIVQLVKDKTGRTLTIDGDIKLKFFPKIGAQIGKVSLSEHGTDKEFAGLTEAQVFVALMPLLSKQVVVDEVHIDGLHANLVKFKDGTTNFSDLTGGNAQKAEPQPVPSESKPASKPATRQPVKLDVSGIRVTNARVGWKDETNGNDVGVEITELKTGRIAEKTPSKIELTAAIKGAKPKVDLLAKLAGTLTFDTAEQRYSFKGLDAKVTGSALDFSGMDLQLKADAEAEKSAVKISGLNLDGKAARGKDSFDVKLAAPSIQSDAQALMVDGLALSATGSMAGMQLTQSNLKMPKLQMNLANNRVLVEGVALTAHAKSATDNVDVTLSAPKLDITPEKASGETVELTAKLAGSDRSGTVVLKLAGVEGSAKALKMAAFTLDVDAKQKDNAVKGTLSTPILGNLEAKVFELPKIVANFTVTSPAIPQKTVQVPLNGWVKADLGKENVTADIVTKFDESNIKAKLGMTKFSAPAYGFDVNIDKLNVDKYMPQQKTEKPTGEPKPKTNEPETPIDFSALKTLNVEGSLKIGDLTAKNVKASNVRVDVRAKDGKLNVDPMSANLYQGSIKGALSVNANTNQIAVKQNLSGVSIGPLMRDLAKQDILEGKGNVSLDVTTQGNLVSAMKKALNGTAKVELKDGAVKGIDLAGAVRGVKSKFGGQDVEQAASKTDKTDFSELSASFDIKNGVAHNEDFSAKSPFFRVSGAGDINIGADSLNYLVKAAVVASMAGQGGKDIADLKGLELPVRVSGTFDNLKYKLEFGQMLSGVGKEQLKVLKDTAKDALKGQLDDLKKQFREGKSSEQGQGATSGTAAAPEAKRPEEKLKDKLKGLLR
jgi:AsmA protein